MDFRRSHARVRLGRKTSESCIKGKNRRPQSKGDGIVAASRLASFQERRAQGRVVVRAGNLAVEAFAGAPVAGE